MSTSSACVQPYWAADSQADSRAEPESLALRRGRWPPRFVARHPPAIRLEISAFVRRESSAESRTVPQRT